MKGTYEGMFALTASGRPGSVETVAQMRLTDSEHGVRMQYEADATVTGPLAGVGQRLMAAAARRTTQQFLSALDDHLRAPATVEEARVQPRYEVERARPAGDTRVIVTSALAGFGLALIGVAVGRWTARR